MKRVSILLLLSLLLSAMVGCKGNEPVPTPAPAPSASPTAQPVLAPLYTPAPAPTPLTFPAMGYINSEGVNIREAPDKNANIMDIMGENAVVHIIAKEGEWYRIELSGETAYASEALITIGDPPRKDNMHWAEVKSKEAQLYKSPSETDLSDVKLKEGEAVKVLRKIGDYLHIVYNKNLQRYIKEADVAYISELEYQGFTPAPAGTPVSTGTPLP